MNKTHHSAHTLQLSARWKEASIPGVLGSSVSSSPRGRHHGVFPASFPCLTSYFFGQRGGKTGSFKARACEQTDVLSMSVQPQESENARFWRAGQGALCRAWVRGACALRSLGEKWVGRREGRGRAWGNEHRSDKGWGDGFPWDFFIQPPWAFF